MDIDEPLFLNDESGSGRLRDEPEHVDVGILACDFASARADHMNLSEGDGLDRIACWHAERACWVHVVELDLAGCRDEPVADVANAEAIEAVHVSERADEADPAVNGAEITLQRVAKRQPNAWCIEGVDRRVISDGRR